MKNLNIQMENFSFSEKIFQDKDTIRISITTLPENEKEAFQFDGKRLQDAHPFFTVKKTKNTRKIIIVFRKKSISEKDPIIASTTIKSELFPKSFSDANNSQQQIINIYEPIQKPNASQKSQRKIVGQMSVQFSLSQDVPHNFNVKHQIGKQRNGQGYSKMESYNNNENAIQSIFD